MDEAAAMRGASGQNCEKKKSLHYQLLAKIKTENVGLHFILVGRIFRSMT